MMETILAQPFEHIDDAAQMAAIGGADWETLTVAMARVLMPALYAGWSAAVDAKLAEHDVRPSVGLDDEEAPLSRGDAVEVASRVSARLEQGGGAPIAFDMGSLWQYCDGVWSALDEWEVTNAIGDMSGTPVYMGEDKNTGEPKYRGLKIDGTSAIEKHLHAMPRRWGQGPGFFEEAPRGVAFEDCFLEVLVDGNEGLIAMREPGPEHLVRAQFDFKYDPSATCPRFESYLHDIWGDESDYRERCDMLQEFMGAALMGLATRYHRMMVLYGVAGGGKSTLLKILSSLFPLGTVTGVSPGKFDDDDRLRLLITAKLNTVAEASGDALLDQDRIKSVVEGEYQTIVSKYEKAARFKPEAAHIIALNDFSVVPGAHPSFWDRIMMMDLTRTFRGTEKETRGLAEIIAREEKSGLVAWAIEGAQRLLRQNTYTKAPCSDRLVKLWKSEADSVAMWLDSNGEGINGPYWTSASDLHQNFREWANKSDFNRVTVTTFGRRLAHHGVKKKRNKHGLQYNMQIKSTGYPI